MCTVDEADLADPMWHPSTDGLIQRHKAREREPVSVQPVDDDALWLWGTLQDFERKGLLTRDPDEMLSTMLDHMQTTTRHLALASPNGRDASAFIVSANLARRNLSKGQQAMALAMIYPEPGKGGRGHKGKLSEFRGQFSADRITQARAVLRHSRALATDVIQGHKSLDTALRQVTEEQEASASVEAQLTELRRAAPDLAELVDEDRLALNEAYSAMQRSSAPIVGASFGGKHTGRRTPSRVHPSRQQIPPYTRRVQPPLRLEANGFDDVNAFMESAIRQIPHDSGRTQADRPAD
jgi:hypothetical protein